MLIDLDVLRTRIGVATSCDACGKIHNVLVDHCINGEHCTTTNATCSADWVQDDHSTQCCNCRGAVKPRRSYLVQQIDNVGHHPEEQAESNQVDATRDGEHRDQETDSGSDQQNQHDSRHVDPFSLRGRL